MKHTPVTNDLASASDLLRRAIPTSLRKVRQSAKRLEYERAELKGALEEMVDLYGMSVNATIIKARGVLENLQPTETDTTEMNHNSKETE